MADKNLFTYCDNNPVMRKDASGKAWITIGIMAVGGIIGAGMSAISSAATQYITTGEVNWKSVAVSGVSGFVSGAVAASPLGLVGQQVAGGIIGGLSYAADRYVNDKPIEADALIASTVAGAISGRIGGEGANVNNNLTRTIQTSRKTVSRMAGRSCLEYAQKRIVSTKSWSSNIISLTMWQASIRFAAGLGASNGIISGYDKIR